VTHASKVAEIAVTHTSLLCSKWQKWVMSHKSKA